MEQVTKFKEIFQGLERLTKSGNIHVVIRTDSQLDGVKEGEMIIDYSYDSKAPVLKVIRDGEPLFLYTESDRLFREFVANVFQIGTADEGNGYGTSIYFKLQEGPDGSTGYNKETVTAFYNEFKDNDTIKPYLKHVKRGEEVDKLYPFMDTNHVYFDISELFTGDQDVRTVSEVMLALMDEVTKITTTFTTLTNAMSTDITKLQEDLATIDDEQDSLLDLLKATNDANVKTMEDLTTYVNNLVDNAEKAIRPLDFFLTNTDDIIIPVRFKVTGGKNTGGKNADGSSILEQFMSSIYIASNSFGVIAKIGDEVMWDGGEFSTTKAHDWTLCKTIASETSIYSVEQINNSEFIVYMRTGRYVIFNKYIDSLIITPELNNESGRPCVALNTVLNDYVNGPLYKNITYTHRFTNGLLITKALAFSSGVKMAVK